MSEPYPQIDQAVLNSLLTALSEPFDPSQVKSRTGQGGKQFRYIDGKTALDRMNATAEAHGLAVSTGILFPPTVIRGIAADRHGNIADEIWITGWVEIHGAGRKSDVGTALHVNEDSVKGAYTDMVKRCLRQYGVAGDLYDDQPGASYYQQQGQQSGGGGNYQQSQGGQGSYGNQNQYGGNQGSYGGGQQGGGQRQDDENTRKDAQGVLLLGHRQMGLVNSVLQDMGWDSRVVVTNVLGPDISRAVNGDIGSLRYGDGKKVIDAMMAEKDGNPAWGRPMQQGDYGTYPGEDSGDQHRFSQAPAPEPVAAPAAPAPDAGALSPNLGRRVIAWQDVVRAAEHDIEKWKPLVGQAGSATKANPEDEWMFEVLLQFADRLILEGIDAYLEREGMRTPRLMASITEHRQRTIEQEAAQQKG